MVEENEALPLRDVDRLESWVEDVFNGKALPEAYAAMCAEIENSKDLFSASDASSSMSFSIL